MDERQMEYKKERIFENTCVAVNVKSKEILSIMKVTDDLHIHDSKVLPELVDGILKSDKTVDKLFADGAYDNNDIFRCLTDKGTLPYFIKVRNNSRAKWKKETLEIYQFWPRKKICKSGRTAKDMDKDGLL
jgi:Transposase DDE domain